MTTKQRNAQNNAAAKREAKRQAHAAMMAQHAAHRERVSVWITAYEAWRASNGVGPRPIHPLDAGTGRDQHAYRYDVEQGHFDLFNQGDADADLVSAAAELGIDLHI
jgi:hypothetical protein